MIMRVDSSCPFTQAVCLAPTRELALQIYGVAQKMRAFRPDITIRTVMGGDTIHEQIREHIVIGTPGKVIGVTKGSARRPAHLDVTMMRVFVRGE